MQNIALAVFFSGVSSVWPAQCRDARVVAVILVVDVVRVGLNVLCDLELVVLACDVRLVDGVF